MSDDTAEKYEALLQRQRAFYDEHITRELPYRLTALDRLREGIVTHEAELEEALRADLGKAPFESYTTEIGMVLSEISYVQRNLRRWARERRVPTPITLIGSRSRVHYEPRGVVLIIAPWNYPVNLSLLPLVGAIAAGNCAVVKPSGEAPRSAQCLQQIIAECYEDEYIAMTDASRETTDVLLQLPWDYIFYTGGGDYARRVMEAAANHLTPVTLELGGKSPCIVDDDADLRTAARRIVWGKLLNAGQTCVAPDTLMVHSAVKERLIAAIIAEVEAQYGSDPSQSSDYPRIVNERHYDRLTALMQCGTIVYGGACNREQRYIAPTLIEGAPATSALMQEEIFGPLLPIVTFTDIDDCVEHVNTHPTPLALYYFTRSKKRAQYMIDHTSAGGVCINDTIVHVANSHLPFGGVGASGMGQYHGRHSFEAMSHAKAVMSTTTRMYLGYKCAPYGERLLRWVKRLLR